MTTYKYLFFESDAGLKMLPFLFGFFCQCHKFRLLKHLAVKPVSNKNLEGKQPQHIGRIIGLTIKLSSKILWSNLP